MACSDLSVQHKVTLSVNTTPDSTETWAVVGEGFENFDENLNKVVLQKQFLGNGGNAKTFVTGQQAIVALTGVRVFGDVAQDFIFSKKYKLLCDVVTDFKIEYTTNAPATTTILYEDATMVINTEFGGAATDGSAIAVDIHSSQEPVVSGGDILGSITVVSVAGTGSGDTAIYVNPALSATSYVYKTAATVDLPDYGDDLTVGWTAWNGTADITATTGNQIAICEVDGSTLAIKGGKAIVTSLA